MRGRLGLTKTKQLCLKAVQQLAAAGCRCLHQLLKMLMLTASMVKHGEHDVVTSHSLTQPVLPSSNQLQRPMGASADLAHRSHQLGELPTACAALAQRGQHVLL